MSFLFPFSVFCSHRALFFVALLVANIFVYSAQAQTLSPAQIEQFKRLPEAQQRALAESAGIDFDQISQLINSEQGLSTEGQNPVDTITGTRLDPRLVDPKLESEGLPFFEDQIEALGELMEEEEELKPYGYDIFDLGAEAFTPASDIPVPYEYVLGPGDTIQIQLYGKESASYSLTISRDGSIQFPDIGPISMAGLNYERAVEKIHQIVDKQMIGIKASVSLGALRTIRIFILGEANIPGSYVVGSLSTMTNALFASGGISELGSLRNIQLKRAGKVITTLDLYDLLINGDTSGDTRLLPGDVIFVPVKGRTAAVSGAVKRPAIYELNEERNAADLLQLAGGLLPTAYLPSTKIERISASGEKTFVDINLKEGTAAFAIKDADVLKVASSLDNVVGAVSLTGHVKREDQHAWRPGLRFTDLISSPNALKDLPDLNIALIEREIPSSRSIEILTFSPQKAFANPKSEHDPILNLRDSLVFFDYETDRAQTLLAIVEKLQLQANIDVPHQVVRISGSVKFPGDYPLAANMNAIDLVNLAGGFAVNAITSQAEITRYEIDDNRAHTVRHLITKLNQENMQLQSGDSLIIKQIPMWRDREIVTLEGEFVFPGEYPILPGESLIDVIRRAGGLTPEAYPEGAVFSRAELRELEQERLKNLRDTVESDIVAAQLESDQSSTEIDTEQADEILSNIDNTEALGRMVIDLKKILDNPKGFDFKLEHEDIITVPRFKPTVTVIGEVQYATSHFYDKRLSLKDYLTRSGGLKHKADKKRIYVIKANGEIYKPKAGSWFRTAKGSLNPGDTIVVPLDTRSVDRVQIWASVTTILYQAALGIAAIASL